MTNGDATDEGDATTQGEQSGFCCKVGWVGHEYDMAERAQSLGNQWGPGEEQASLRELQTQFNTAILRAAMEAAGEQPTDGELDSYYRTVTQDEVPAEEREDTRTRLELQGVAVDEVTQDFVGYGTVRRHVTDCLGHEYQADEATQAPQIEDLRTRVRSLESRVDVVADDAIETLQRHDVLPAGEYEVLTDVSVRCSACGAYLSFEELLDEGCDCGDVSRTDTGGGSPPDSGGGE